MSFDSPAGFRASVVLRHSSMREPDERAALIRPDGSWKAGSALSLASLEDGPAQRARGDRSHYSKSAGRQRERYS